MVLQNYYGLGPDPPAATPHRNPTHCHDVGDTRSQDTPCLANAKNSLKHSNPADLDIHSAAAWDEHTAIISSLLDAPVDAAFTSDPYGVELAVRIHGTLSGKKGHTRSR